MISKYDRDLRHERVKNEIVSVKYYITNMISK